MISSAFGGAYLIVKGAGMLIGNYPDEVFIADRVQLHLFEEIPVAYYVYLSLILVLGVAFLFIQVKIAPPPESPTSAEDQNYDSSGLDNYKSMTDDPDVSIDVLPEVKKDNKSGSIRAKIY